MLKPKYENSVEFQVWGDYALFSDPLTRVGGEKFSYSVPTYEAIREVLNSIYWKSALTRAIDSMKIKYEKEDR